MAGVRSKPNPNGKYQGFFKDKTGKPRYFMGTKNKKETLALARELEEQHRHVRDKKSGAVKHADRPFEEVAKEYQAWGNAQGGRGGRPWGPDHSLKRKKHLESWPNDIEITNLGELVKSQPSVEAVIRDMKAKGLAGKTIKGYLECLQSFCNWCVERGYLGANPLTAVKWRDTTPKSRRRAMTLQEVRLILNAADEHRSLVYEVSFCTGLRKRELMLLTPDDLDMDRCGINLRPEITKNRKAGFKPISQRLMSEPRKFAMSGKAEELYSRFNSRKDSTLNLPDNPLLFVPTHISRSFDADRERAGVAKEIRKEKIDFHACRVAYINFVVEDAPNIKEAQEAARHCTPELTMNVYARSRDERQTALAEQIDRKISGQSIADSLQIVAVGAEDIDPTDFDGTALGAAESLWRIGDSNP